MTERCVLARLSPTTPSFPSRRSWSSFFSYRYLVSEGNPLDPLRDFVLSTAVFTLGKEAARGQLAQQIATLAGKGAGEAIQAAVQSSAAQKATGLWATVISTALLLFGASTVFAELKDALN